MALADATHRLCSPVSRRSQADRSRFSAPARMESTATVPQREPLLMERRSHVRVRRDSIPLNSTVAVTPALSFRAWVTRYVLARPATIFATYGFFSRTPYL